MMLDHLVDQTIAEVVRRVDLDEVVSRLDIDAVLDRLDLTQTVLNRVDLDVVVRQVLSGWTRRDRGAGGEGRRQRDRAHASTSRPSSTGWTSPQTVLKRVDLVRVVDAVLDQMDLIALANEIIDGVDLPEIIRDSTGSMASETVKGVRMQGIGADQAVDRAIDRLLLRRSRSHGTAGS